MLTLESLDQSLSDSRELFAMARDEVDDGTLASVASDLQGMEKSVVDMEFRRMFSNPMDPNNCFLDIQSGSGGTEAQDWAQMLFRMYTRYGEKHGYTVDVLEESAGDVAGIKSAALKISGDSVDRDAAQIREASRRRIERMIGDRDASVQWRDGQIALTITQRPNAAIARVCRTEL